MSFAWRNKIKAAKQEGGREIVLEVTPAEIIAAPNRYRTENITQSLCIAMTELMIREETREAKHEEILNAIRQIKESIQAKPKDERDFSALVVSKATKKKKKKLRTPVAKNGNGTRHAR